MNIATYCITFPEEYDILPNMVRQARELGDVWLVDGGPKGHLCHHPRADLDPWAIKKIAEEYDCKYTQFEWPGNPGAQRNRALAAMEPFNYDWIIQNDSDELWPNESIDKLIALLNDLKCGEPNVTNIKVKVLPLIGDEDHYCRKYAHHLTHARIHRPGVANWGETWHEHLFVFGDSYKSDIWLLHTNWLFEDRLRRIKGHGLEGWSGLDHTPFPADRFGLTWPELRYPEGERR